MDHPTLEEISATLASHPVYVVLAESLPGWRSPATPGGRETLLQHYRWAADLRARGLLLFAGPVNPEAMGPGHQPAAGALTGLLVFRGESREAVERLAHQEPFHLAGYRRNVVHAWSVRFVQEGISQALGAALAAPVVPDARP